VAGADWIADVTVGVSGAMTVFYLAADTSEASGIVNVDGLMGAESAADSNRL
jgi:hypothetical protein